MMGPATSIATDLREGIVDRFRSLPMSRSAFLVGHMIAELAAAMLGIAVLTLTGLDRRLAHPRRPAARGRRLRAAAAVRVAMLWLGTLLGLLVRSPDAVAGHRLHGRCSR